MSSEIAAQLREFLREAAGEGGTGERAQLTNYAVLGKTGTAIRFVDGRYVRGQYTASFAAIFPADHPQLVVIVKIDHPRGVYYGGLTAAPVTRTMLQQALASRRVAIDRGRLAARGSTEPEPKPPSSSDPAGPPPVVVSLPYRPPRESTAPRPVPDVAGRSIREAALALHRRGFRVSLQGVGRVVRTVPAGGENAGRDRRCWCWRSEPAAGVAAITTLEPTRCLSRGLTCSTSSGVPTCC